MKHGKCPFCGMDDEDEFAINTLKLECGVFYRGACSCGATGPMEETKEEALAAWDARAEDQRRCDTCEPSIVPQLLELYETLPDTEEKRQVEQAIRDLAQERDIPIADLFRRVTR